MSSSKKREFHSKTVKFNGEDLELYSLDGFTWSTRKDELLTIEERHESNKVTFQEIRSGIVQKKKPSKDAQAAKTDVKAQDVQEKKEPAKKASPAKAPSKKTTAKKTAAKKTTAKKASAKKAAPKKRASAKKKASSRKKDTKAA